MASDDVETVLTVAHESSDFGLKSIKNHSKILILQGFLRLGPGCRRFKSCHSDQSAVPTANVAVSAAEFVCSAPDGEVSYEHSYHMKTIRTFSSLESRSDYLFYSSIQTLIVRNENSHRQFFLSVAFLIHDSRV